MTMQELYDAAREAGLKAGADASPTPFHLIEASILDEPLPGAKTYTLPDGPCGFGWVTVPGAEPFAKWLLAQKGLAHRETRPARAVVWVSDFDQSHDRKLAYAHAFAVALNQNGVAAWADSRLD